MPVKLTVCGRRPPGWHAGAIGSSVGASLTAVTVTVKVRVIASTPPLAVPPSSRTVTVMTAVPDRLARGVKLREPVALGLV
jgi:hypothetical protein